VIHVSSLNVLKSKAATQRARNIFCILPVHHRAVLVDEAGIDMVFLQQGVGCIEPDAEHTVLPVAL
jgi:hypothetical protein